MMLDPLLLYMFVNICPKKELCNLIPKIYPFISMLFLATQFSEKKGITAAEVCIIIIIVMMMQGCCAPPFMVLSVIVHPDIQISATKPLLNNITAKFCSSSYGCVIWLVNVIATATVARWS